MLRLEGRSVSLGHDADIPSTHEKYAQELRVRVRVDVPPGLHIQELAKVLGVHQVAVDAHGESEGRVDVKGLRLRPITQTSVSDT